MGEIWSVSIACVCLRKIMQLSRFVNENRKKNRQNAFLNEKFIQYKLTIKPAIFLAVEFPEVLENFAESPRLE